MRGAPKDDPFVIDARTIELGDAFTLSCPLGDIDFLATVEPIGGYDQLLPHAERHDLPTGAVLTISLEDLIRVKRHIARPKDSESLFQLLAIQRVRRETGLR